MSIHLKFVVAQEKEESGLTFGAIKMRFYIVVTISGRLGARMLEKYFRATVSSTKKKVNCPTL